MPGPLVALAGAGILGAGASYAGASKQAKAANRATDAASAAQAEQLAFEREKLAKWEDVYGPIQQNLASYYTNLTPDYFTVQGLQNFQQEQQTALTNAREILAQRGLATSGVAAATEIASAQQTAEGRARIRTEAPMKTAEVQSRFLQIGLGQNPGGTLSQALSQSTNVATQNAQLAQKSAQQAAGAAGKAFEGAAMTTGLALADYFKPTTVAAGVPVGSQAFTSAETGRLATFGL